MVKAISRTIAVFNDEKNWQKIMRNAMVEDFSWENSARLYTELYNKILDK